jgi:hypothetical protein
MKKTQEFTEDQEAIYGAMLEDLVYEDFEDVEVPELPISKVAASPEVLALQARVTNLERHIQKQQRAITRLIAGVNHSRAAQVSTGRQLIGIERDLENKIDRRGDM